MKYALLFLLASLSANALAHHSRVQYDTTKIVEMSGEIVAVRWRNPHVMYTLRSSNDRGEEEDWHLEAGSIYMLGRTGITVNRVKVGDQVRVAGYISSRGGRDFYLTNVLLPSGQEVVMVPAAQPYWSDDAVGGKEQWSANPALEAVARNASRGIFRVWSMDRLGVRLTGSDRSSLPLTRQARDARAAFDPLEDDPVLDCIDPGMPRPMLGPHPVQFIDRGDEIELLIAEFDIRRTIRLGGNEIPESIRPTKQGYSRGTWLGDTLEVHTSRVNWPFHDGVGTPQSLAVEMVERFSLSDDKRRLNYEITVTDPPTFTEPVSRSRYWVDLGEPMEIYNCIAGK